MLKIHLSSICYFHLQLVFLLTYSWQHYFLVKIFTGKEYLQIHVFIGILIIYLEGRYHEFYMRFQDYVGLAFGVT